MSHIVRKATQDDRQGLHDAHMRSIREICVKDHGEDEIKGWGYTDLDGAQKIIVGGHPVTCFPMRLELRTRSEV